MKNNRESCVAIGNFDGIHIGHDILIRRMIELSHETNQDSIIITFKYIKKELKKSSFNIKYINNQNTKLEILKSYNVTDVVEIQLDEVVSKYSPEQFIKEILIDKYNAKNIVVGFNFSFGYKAEGNIGTLKSFEEKYGYYVEEIYPVKCNGVAVSSTLIRSLLKNGKIHEANLLLVDNYTLFHEGIKMDYNKNIGFVNNKSSIIVPSDGKYSVMVGDKKVVLTIITNKTGSVLTFDKIIEKNKDIVFLDKYV
ncbi:MAG: hypothetical protein ACERLG_06890 [Sedimentibacter sp.]